MKSNDEILNQLYISASDLQILIQPMGRTTAIKYIKEIQEEMKEKGLFIPNTKTKLALTKLVRKRFGI